MHNTKIHKTTHFCKFLRFFLNIRYGGTTYQNQKAKEDKKKAGSKAAIGKIIKLFFWSLFINLASQFL